METLTQAWMFEPAYCMMRMLVKCMYVYACESFRTRQTWHPVDFDLFARSIWGGKYFRICDIFFLWYSFLKKHGYTAWSSVPADLFINPFGVSVRCDLFSWWTALTITREDTFKNIRQRGSSSQLVSASCHVTIVCLQAWAFLQKHKNNYTLGPHSSRNKHSK